MADYIEIDTRSGVIGITYRDDKAYISTHRGRDVELHIPAYADFGDISAPVCGVGRKAFLSDRYLNDICLPDGVMWIDEWAFAGCRNLKRISLPQGTFVGNGAFRDCHSLEQVELRVKDKRYGDNNGSDYTYLLAAVIRLMDDRFLFDLQNAGSDDWIEKWDMRMETILSERDEEGFSKLLACGEEDYEGSDNTLESYLTRRRARKVRLCLVRLLHDRGLNDARRERITGYLYEHRAGADSPDTWRVVLTEHGDEEEYYRLLGTCGCIDDSNIDIMLDDLGDSHTEMKSFLIRLHSEMAGNSFFDSMRID